MKSFDPLTIFKDCNNYEYFIFLRSIANVEIEQILYISRRDYIYSYFGEGESSIKSVGGVWAGYQQYWTLHKMEIKIEYNVIPRGLGLAGGLERVMAMVEILDSWANTEAKANLYLQVF